jgi:endonuclease YncB( thermonuclease family)
MPTGIVQWIVDGDTIHVATENGRILKIRLYGIDAPELSVDKRGRHQPYAEQAKTNLKSLIDGQRITYQTMDTDRYGRIVAIVYYRQNDVNLEMIKNGSAWAYPRYLDKNHLKTYEAAESRARRTKTGLWSLPDPQSPWEYKKHLHHNS